ncbi:hypothetical protein NE237_017703 [Protea cynaroides]|uniref:Uncharacterized protein n=1 Tax=Protea cynaroides TaxID=273540 RepID=A0A9Q0K8I4_9MAGN|nr:hypothetical protein NE237_017703 [Protea cynaroides]
MAFSGSSFFFSAASSLPLNSIQNLGRTNSVNIVPSMAINYGGGSPESLRLISKPPNNYMDGFRIEHMEKSRKLARFMIQELEDPLENMLMVLVINLVIIGKADVFNKFTGKKGQFRLELSEDMRGLKSLYEASHLGMEEETLLDEAKDFAHKHLKAKMATLKPELARAVGEILEHPYHKNLARFKLAKHFPSSYSTYNTYGWISPLQELARMDFNIVQSLHQQELLQILEWWRDMGLSKHLKFARDQPLKWHIWSMTVLSDPKHSEQRIELTKPISLVYIIDDIFDVYGTLDELILFTEAVNKWEPTIIDRLPDYMKICFNALDKISNEISDKVLREHGWNPTSTLRKEWASLCDAFLVEAKWFAYREEPKANDYLKNGVISSGLPLVLVHAFFLLGQGLSKESVDCVEHTPTLISHPATILRLWDDLGSAKVPAPFSFRSLPFPSRLFLSQHSSMSLRSSGSLTFPLSGAAQGSLTFPLPAVAGSGLSNFSSPRCSSGLSHFPAVFLSQRLGQDPRQVELPKPEQIGDGRLPMQRLRLPFSLCSFDNVFASLYRNVKWSFGAGMPASPSLDLYTVKSWRDIEVFQAV